MGNEIQTLGMALKRTLDEQFLEKREPWAVYSNWASEIGNPCERYLLYKRLRWKELLSPETYLLKLMDGGREAEIRARRRFEKRGFKVDVPQQTRTWSRYEISGRPDLLLYPPPSINLADFGAPKTNRILCEVKCMSPFTWEEIDDIDDMINHKRHYVKKYPAQLLIYLFLEELPVGIFYWENKLNYDYKIFETYAESNTEYVEKLLMRAERTNKRVKEFKDKGDCVWPDRINSFDMCKDCSAREICLPEYTTPLQDKLDLENEKLAIELLFEREGLKKANRDYNSVNNKLKDLFGAYEFTKTEVGDFIVTQKTVSKKEYWVKASEYKQHSFKLKPIDKSKTKEGK